MNKRFKDQFSKNREELIAASNRPLSHYLKNIVLSILSLWAVTDIGQALVAKTLNDGFDFVADQSIKKPGLNKIMYLNIHNIRVEDPPISKVKNIKAPQLIGEYFVFAARTTEIYMPNAYSTDKNDIPWWQMYRLTFADGAVRIDVKDTPSQDFKPAPGQESLEFRQEGGIVTFKNSEGVTTNITFLFDRGASLALVNIPYPDPDFPARFEAWDFNGRSMPNQLYKTEKSALNAFLESFEIPTRFSKHPDNFVVPILPVGLLAPLFNPFNRISLEESKEMLAIWKPEQPS